ncbi:MAG: hypothetical protein QXY49_01260 [Thermofilaceae archaeon]
MALQHKRRSTVAIDGRLARVYFVLLRSGKPLGVREVQRLAALGSPGAAKHYLDRLVELGFAEKSTGEYVAKVNNDSVMSVYVGLLGNVVPRLIPYAVFCTVLLTAFYLLSKPPLEAIIVAAIPTALLWLEGLRLVRLAKKVSWERQE